VKLATGKHVYSADSPPVKAEGLLFSQADLDGALQDRLPPLLRDDVGRKDVEDFLGGLAKTAFANDRLAAALKEVTPVKDWQVGESLAEAYLVDHKDCEFPWPTGRDLRNPKASPAGADLVGFQKQGKSRRLAFGEVKTSAEEQWPPQVVTSRHGLAKQLEELRDTNQTKDSLLLYLAHRAQNSSWETGFRQSAARYLQDPTDVSIFGFLIRDVAPKPEDIQSRAALLAKGSPPATSVELHALYLPAGSIASMANNVRLRKGGVK
jgi:hypothetical protein